MGVLSRVVAPLRRHPFPMECRFRRSLVVAWAFEAEAIQAMLPAPLEADTYRDDEGRSWGFAAVALVDLEDLRRSGTPRWLGSSSTMAGYRLFARMRNQRGQWMRGLKILRSDVNRTLVATGANLTTRYGYHVTRTHVEVDGERSHYRFTSGDGSADVDIEVHGPGAVPSGSPFADARAARRFAGPLPYTFSSDPDGVVVVKSDREGWTPEPVDVTVRAATFFDRGPFAGLERRLANAFELRDIEYGWRAGQLVPWSDLAPREGTHA